MLSRSSSALNCRCSLAQMQVSEHIVPSLLSSSSGVRTCHGSLLLVVPVSPQSVIHCFACLAEDGSLGYHCCQPIGQLMWRGPFAAKFFIRYRRQSRYWRGCSISGHAGTRSEWVGDWTLTISRGQTTLLLSPGS